MAKPTPQPVDDDVLNSKVATSCLDFLLIELVPLAQRITDQMHAREEVLTRELQNVRLLNSKGELGESHRENPSAGPEAGAGSLLGGGAVDEHLRILDDDTREAVHWRLDSLGYRVGQGLAERFSINKPRPTTPLEAIKFICKDLWTVLFRKQIDNLKTNHRGIFVLTDTRFVPLSKMSVDRRAGPRATEEAMKRAQSYLYFPCGVIRGALAALGVEVTISGETAEIPMATFQIKTKGAKA